MNHHEYRKFVRPLALVTLLLALVSTAAAEWKENVLYSFQAGTDTYSPIGKVVFDEAGNLYGATQFGPEQGAVYQLARPAKAGDPWTESILYTFKGNTLNDGQRPLGGLVIDKKGNLFGVTGYGGTGPCILLGILEGCGAIYELSPPAQAGGAWTETLIYSFLGGSDGDLPSGDLTWDEQGNLYGATQYGGGFGTCNTYVGYCGTIFKLTPPEAAGGTWTEEVLYRFKGGNDGANPNGGLIFDKAGAIYGTTIVGGGSSPLCDSVGFIGCGTVFELKPPAKQGGIWIESLLHRFRGRPTDGSGPNGNLVLRSGNLYGTTIGGGKWESGLVFKLAPPSQTGGRWTETFIHEFNLGEGPGSLPPAGLVEDCLGNLYATLALGPNGAGSIVALHPPPPGGKWAMQALYVFSGDLDGDDPLELTLGKDGAIYGTTEYGGTCTAFEAGCGTVFELVR
jgi:hypothetical protein